VVGGLVCNAFPPAGFQTFFTPTELPVDTTQLSSPTAVGLRFTLGQASTITALRFFRPAGVTDSLTLRVFTADDGTQVAASGPIAAGGCGPAAQWISVPLTTRFQAQANVAYVVVLDGATTVGETQGLFNAAVARLNIRIDGAVVGPPGEMPTQDTPQAPFVDSECRHKNMLYMDRGKRTWPEADRPYRPH
jgi:hypothetical protein